MARNRTMNDEVFNELEANYAASNYLLVERQLSGIDFDSAFAEFTSKHKVSDRFAADEMLCIVLHVCWVTSNFALLVESLQAAVRSFSETHLARSPEIFYTISKDVQFILDREVDIAPELFNKLSDVRAEINRRLLPYIDLIDPKFMEMTSILAPLVRDETR